MKVFSSDSTKKWYLLGLAAASHTFAVALPYACLPVLFEEIAQDLDLSLVQLGTAWGMLGLASAFVALIGGILGDRFGVKRVLSAACILGGLVGALRGLSADFISLTVAIFAFGLIKGLIPPNVHKACGLWFKSRNLATANSIVAVGMGAGLMIAPIISATVLLPWLGSWRYVLFFFGAASMVIGALWLLSAKMPQAVTYGTGEPVAIPLGKALSKLIRLKTLLLMGLALMFRSGCVIGITGYLPLYLSGRGWDTASAGGALSAFYAISTLMVIPISLLSDRTGSRKSLMVVALLIGIFSVGLMPLFDGVAVWILVLAAGFFTDAYIVLTLTLAQELQGVETSYGGATLGIVITFAEVGNFIFPSLGIGLAEINSGLPLVFWAFISLVALVILIYTRIFTRER